MTTTTPTVVACPAWCRVQHDEPGAFHAGPNLRPDDGYVVRLWQQDSPEALPGASSRASC